jgi:hypothetical protein
MKWVEQGVAPERIIATRIEDGKAVRKRPICAYPAQAAYKGSGDVNEAASFTCVTPDASSRPLTGSDMILIQSALRQRDDEAAESLKRSRANRPAAHQRAFQAAGRTCRVADVPPCARSPARGNRRTRPGVSPKLFQRRGDNVSVLQRQLGMGQQPLQRRDELFRVRS